MFNYRIKKWQTEWIRWKVVQKGKSNRKVQHVIWIVRSARGVFASVFKWNTFDVTQSKVHQRNDILFFLCLLYKEKKKNAFCGGGDDSRDDQLVFAI